MKATLVRAGGLGGHLSIWDHPSERLDYVVGVDVAEGKVRDMNSAAKRDMLLATTGSRPDYSAALVFEMETGKHVATWHGYVRPSEFAMTCMAIGFLYNQALLAWEHNSFGIVLTDAFTNYGYPNLYRRHILAGRMVGDTPLTDDFGWLTTAASKPLLIARLSEIISANPGFTRDKRLISELRTMEIDPSTGNARARGRNKDDCVMAAGIALQARFEHLTGQTTPSGDDRIDQLDAYERQVWAKVTQRRGRNLDGLDPHRRRLGVGPRMGVERPRLSRLSREELGRELLRGLDRDPEFEPSRQGTRRYPRGHPRPLDFRARAEPEPDGEARRDE